MAANAQIVVEYVAKTTGLQSATSDVEKTGSRLKSTFGGVAKAVAAGVAVGAVVNFGKTSVKAAQESEEATSRLRNVFKQMGDTTGKAAQAAQDHATALSKRTAIEDESIINAQSMLATFGKVSDQTARQAGIFDRATDAAADLAAAGFGSLDSNAVSLGKALQDPVTGIGKLARAGVTFTDAQKDMIKASVDAGDSLKAQKIILKAVEDQVGGTAAATASEADKMNVAFGEVQESVGTALLPILEELAPILSKIAGFIADNSNVIVPLVGLVAGLAAAIKIVTTAQLLWNIAVSANPLGLIVIGIGLLIAAIVLLVTHWDKVTAAFKKGWDAIKAASQAVFDWFKANWPLLLAILTGPFGLAVAAIVKHWDKIKDVVMAAVNAVKGFLTNLGTAIANMVTAAGQTLGRLAALFDKPADAAKAMLEIIKDAVGAIAGFISGQIGRVAAAVQGVVNAIKGPINAVLSAFNAIHFSIPRISIPSVTIAGHKIGGGEIGGQTFGVPQIPLLASGGVIDRPTLAVVGEGVGREIVAPESLLRQIVNERPISVRVFIGERELTDIVRTEVVSADTGLARTLLAGAAPL